MKVFIFMIIRLERITITFFSTNAVPNCVILRVFVMMLSDRDIEVRPEGTNTVKLRLIRILLRRLSQVVFNLIRNP